MIFDTLGYALVKNKESSLLNGIGSELTIVVTLAVPPRSTWG